MIDYFKKMKKRWKKYFSFSTLKTRDYQAGYAILMIGTLVIDYYKRGSRPYAYYFGGNVGHDDCLFHYGDISRLDSSLEETKKGSG